ncbi:MAG: GldG family protein [Proteobacteria bacterium]|nr:GldG family protein [Pseudomonadota bacterium]
MELKKNKYEKILKVGIPVLMAVSLLWFVFLPHYYRFGYVLLILTGVVLIFAAIINRNKICLCFKDRKNLKSVNAVTTIILTVIIIGAVNYIAYRNERKMDLTRAKINTLSDQTVKVLKNLKDNVHFTAFLEPATDGASFEYAMEKYKYYTNNISYEVVDPNKDPIKARNNNITNYGTVIASVNNNEARFESLTEEDITNSIIKLTRTGKKKIYFLSGHGERDIDSDNAEDYSFIKKIITGQSYTAEKLNLLTLKTVPQDANLLIIAGPKKIFFEKEISAIQNYIKNNGAVFILSDPSSPKYTITPNQNVNRILAGFGVKLMDDVIIDPQSKLFGVTEAMPVIQSYDSGPLDLGILISDKKNNDIVVFGNSSFVANQYVSHAANSDIFMNAVSYLAKDNDLISIRPKTDESGRFSMPGGLLVGLFTVYVVPFSILASGVVYWYKRRRK